MRSMPESSVFEVGCSYGVIHFAQKQQVKANDCSPRRANGDGDVYSMTRSEIKI